MMSFFAPIQSVTSPVAGQGQQLIRGTREPGLHLEPNKVHLPPGGRAQLSDDEGGTAFLNTFCEGQYWVKGGPDLVMRWDNSS